MHKFTTKNGIEFIKKWEGFKPSVYNCSAGYQTIGYGHKLLPTDDYTSVSMEMAEQILAKDLLYFERAVLRYINVKLSDNQFDALVSFTFNLGPATLQRSTLRQKINYCLYEEAAEEFPKWVYAANKKVAGLIYRRQAEVILFQA